MELTRIKSIIDMFSQCNFETSRYRCPEVEVIYMNVEAILCMSFSNSGEGGNTGDDLEPGDDWGGMLS